MSDSHTEKLFSVKEKVVLATGAGGVLVGELARFLAKEGARVVVTDLSQEAANRVTQEITASGNKALGFEMDVLSKQSVNRVLEEVLKGFGRIDVLINGAGGNKPGATTSKQTSFFDLDLRAVQEVFDLNFMGSLIPCQVVGQIFAKQKQGIILNISSMNSFRPLTRIPAYSAAKAAVSNFTQWLAVHMATEYSPDIRVNAVAPGFFQAQQNRFLLLDEKSGGFTPRGRSIIEHTPLGRFGEPADLLGTVLWLISPASSFVNGTVIPIDGGFSAYSGV